VLNIYLEILDTTLKLILFRSGIW